MIESYYDFYCDFWMYCQSLMDISFRLRFPTCLLAKFELCSLINERHICILMKATTKLYT